MKNIMIFGDSYSTFAGRIPQGYAAYYTGKRTSTDESPDVPSADHTWWGLLVKETSANLVRNDSWSGSTIGYTGYSGKDTSQTSSFIYRLGMLSEEGFFEKNEIDTVFVFGGTNDSWSDAPLGEEMAEGFQREDLFSVLPAVHYFFKKLRETLPNARIYGICNCGIKAEIVSAIQNACKAIGAKSIALTDAVDKRSGHPTVQCMMDIKNQVLAALD